MDFAEEDRRSLFVAALEALIEVYETERIADIPSKEIRVLLEHYECGKNNGRPA